MNKKIIALSVVLVILLGVFAGCTKDTTTPDPTAAPTGGTSPAATGANAGEEKEPVTLEWHIALWNNYPDTGKVMEAVSEKIKEKLNTSVNFHVSIDADYKTRTTTMLNAGQYLDMLYLSPGTVPFLENAQRGALYPLEELLPAYAPQIWETIPQEAWDAVTVDGHIYAVVPMKDLADNLPIFYDSYITEKYNVKVPQPYEWTTLYDLVDFIYAMQDARIQEYPGVGDKYPMGNAGNMQFTFFSPYQTIAGAAGMSIPGFVSFEGKAEGEVFNIYDTPEYRKYCQTMRQFVADGVFSEDKEFNKDNSIDTKRGWALAQGQVVVDRSTNENFEMSESNYIVMSTAYVRAVLNGISSNSKYPERSMEVFELVNADREIGTMLRFGIEGEHWNAVGEDQVSFTGTANENPSERAYHHWYGAQWGSIINMRLPEGIDLALRPGIVDLVEEANKNTALGFVFDSTPVQNEIAACTNVISEYHDILSYGIVADVDGSVDEFVSKLNENGVAKIVEESQRQYDAWIAAKCN